VIFCLNIETGEQQYAKRSPGSIWATPLGIGNRLCFFGKDGTITVIKSGAEFEQLATNALWSDDSKAQIGPDGGSLGGHTLYAAAMVDSQLVLRRGDIMCAIGH